LSGTSRARALPESIWTRRGTSCFPPPDLLNFQLPIPRLGKEAFARNHLLRVRLQEL
jgi:hypothetical protein